MPKRGIQLTEFGTTRVARRLCPGSVLGTKYPSRKDAKGGGDGPVPTSYI